MPVTLLINQRQLLQVTIGAICSVFFFLFVCLYLCKPAKVHFVWIMVPVEKMLFSLMLSYSVDYCILKAEINITVIRKASDWHCIFRRRVQGFKIIPLKEYLLFFLW